MSRNTVISTKVTAWREAGAGRGAEAEDADAVMAADPRAGPADCQAARPPDRLSRGRPAGALCMPPG
jgi:hypothetical protein